MRDQFIATYKLRNVEVRYLEAASEGLSQAAIAKKMKVGLDHAASTRKKLYKKTGAVSREMLAALGKWLVTGKRPAGDAPDVWKCKPEPDGCGLTKAIGEFPFWPVDVRCASCIEEQVETTKMLAKRRKARRMLNDALKAMKAQWVRLPNINNMLGELIDKGGGYSRFVGEWYKQIELAKSDHPGSKYVLDHHRDVVRLIAAANEAEAARFDVESMDEEQTKEFLTNVILEQLAKKGAERLLNVYEPDEPKSKKASPNKPSAESA